MELDEAYQILEVEPGADEETVREARKTLAKVWHPDRHANDPALQAKAQDKLADVNAAFELVEKAGFPKAVPKPPPPRAEPPKAEPPKAEPPKPAARLDPDAFEPPRRIRWSVILVLAATLGIGAYLAITKLGASTPAVATADARAIDPPDAGVVVVVAPDTALALVDPSDATTVATADAAVDDPWTEPVAVRREKTFTLGSTRDDVIFAMGRPNGTTTNRSTINGVRTASARLTYGESSTIDFDGDDKVVGWAEVDSPLHVRLDIKDKAAADAAKKRGTIAIGSTTDEVLGVLGPPSGYTKTRWSYGSSTLDIEGGKVAGITQGEPKLPTGGAR